MSTRAVGVMMLTLIGQADPARDEIARALDASRQAIAGKTLHASFSPGSAVADVLMGAGGRPRIIRWTGAIASGIVGGDGTRSEWRDELTMVTEYTGRPARRCDGTAQRGELVVSYDYRDSTKTWTTTAFALASDVVGPSGVDQALAMLRGAKAMTNGQPQQLDGRWAREIIAAWEPPADRNDPRSQPPVLTGDPRPNVKGDPALNETIQSLWIDAESSLPLRWEVTKRGVRVQAFDFRYEPIDLQPPAGVTPPDCSR